MGIDLETYRQESLETWGEMASGWERRREWLLETTGLVNDWLVRRADPQPGQSILEIAAGTGEANRALGLRSTVLLDATGNVAASFGANGTPMAVLIDAGGKVASDVVAGGPAVLDLGRGAQAATP